MPKSWKCEYGCPNPVSELGAYVKISSSKYAHLICHDEAIERHAIQIGRQALLGEQLAEKQRQEEQDRREVEEIRARERAEAERRMEVAERERTNRILAAQKIPMPAKIEPKKEEANAKQEERPDRFKLIDLE